MRNTTYRKICAHAVQLLHEERKRLKLSKYAMAERSGLSEQMIGYVERGLRQPSLETAVRMAAALNIDLGKVLKKAQRLAKSAP